MKNRTKIILIIVVLALATVACSFPSIRTPKIEIGSGKEISEDRAIDAFTGIDFLGGGKIILVHGSEHKLNITGEDNVLRYITSEVKNDVLVIDYEEDVVATLSTKDVTFTITYVDINKLEVNGGALIEADKLGAQNLQIRINGGGSTNITTEGMDALDVRLDGGNNFIISGKAISQTVEINGGGNYDAGDLETEATAISLLGAGNAEVWATKTLDVNLLWVGRVSYWGSPIVSQDVKGLSAVESLGDK